MAITYMQRRKSGIYEFRRMVPRALAGRPVPGFARYELAEMVNAATGCFKRELTVSLKTADPREAKQRDSREAARVSDLFAKAEALVTRGPANPLALSLAAIDLAALQSSTVAQLLARDEEEREGDDRRHLQTAEERAGWPDLEPVPHASAKHMMQDHWLVYGDELEERDRAYRRALSRRDPSIVQGELRVELHKLGIQVNPKVDGYHEAGLAVLRGHVEAYGLLRKRQGGDDIPTPQLMALPVSPAGGPKLTAAYTAWKAGSSARGARKPGERTILEADHAVRRFVELHGDLTLGEISREKTRSFRDAMAKMPTRLTAKLKVLSLPRLVEHPDAAGLPRPHAATVNKALNLLSAIVANAEKEGLTDSLTAFVNPFGKSVKLVVEDREDDGREPFTKADLELLFTSPVYSAGKRPLGGGGEGAFWLPLIALLSGARQSEIAQLRVADLAQDPETGIWHFDIGTAGGRSIKTASSRRKVPVHPVLEEVGLLRYRQALVDGGSKLDASLWPAIEEDSKGRKAGKWSKWFNRYLSKTANVPEKTKVFHSFRHTFKRLARDAGLSEELHDALTGHSGGSVGRSYGAGFGLLILSEAIERLDVTEVIKVLRWRPDVD